MKKKKKKPPKNIISSDGFNGFNGIYIDSDDVRTFCQEINKQILREEKKTL